MKRALILIATVALAAGAWAVYQAAAPAPVSLAQSMPPGAQLYLEAKDFGGLLAEWSASPQKASWLKSDNYSGFSRSRLFLRLADAQKEFAAAAGLPPDMKFATEVAGQQSAIAIYDIGKLEFVYVTRMPSAKSMQTAIWQLRTRFEPRSVNGANFFVHTDPESKRVVGFGATDDYLVLGTREDLIAGAMSLLAGQQARNLAGADWYRKAVTAGQKQPGDLRMVLNLAEIGQTPQFRTYWIQQNITEMRQYSSAVVDLYRSSSEYREERTLLPASEDENAVAEDAAQGVVTVSGAQAVADVLRFAPSGGGVYRAFANPTAKEALRLMTVKILAPHMGPAPAQKIAPSVTLTSGESGSESDLETRIDQAPASHTATGNSTDPLSAQLSQANLRAVLQVEESTPAQNGVFVRPHTVLVLVASNDWNGDAVRAAIQTILQPALTAGQSGVEWVKSGSLYRLSGLAPAVMATQSKYLFLADDESMLGTVMARSATASKVQPASYVAGFSHATERRNFLRFVDLVDRAPVGGRGSQSANDRERNAAEGDDQPASREPQFFSDHIAGLSGALKDVASESVVVRRTGGRVQQTVIYGWSK